MRPGGPRTQALLDGLHHERVDGYGPEIDAEEMAQHPVDDLGPSGRVHETASEEPLA